MAQLTVQQLFDLAVKHQEAGRLPDAQRVYQKILARQPRHGAALFNSGAICLQLGQSQMAVDLMGRAIALRPNHAEAHSNLGGALADVGRVDEAIAAYRQAISINPNLPGTHSNLGKALADKGQIEEAIAAYQRAIAVNPNYAKAYNNLGLALVVQGRLDEAIATYRQAITLNPNYAKALNNLGAALSGKGRFDEAVAALRQAAGLSPEDAEIHNHLGNALASNGLFDGAVAAYRQAIGLKPDDAQALSNLGDVLSNKGQCDEAIAVYRQAVDINPNAAHIHGNLIYTLHFHPRYDTRAIAEENARWNVAHAEPLRRLVLPHGNDRSPERRLRIGYVSADFCDHASANFLVPLLANHDREQVEVFCYAEVSRPTEMTERLKERADGWRSTVGLSDERVAQQVREDRIDILVDLKVHTAGNRLLVFARKPAPVQVTWLGYPGSTGMGTMDYRLSDPYLDPPDMDESVYSEKTIRLPDSFWCYEPLEGGDIAVNGLPALEKGFVTFGCLNNFCKVNPELLAMWARVMREAAGSRLMLLAPEGDHRQRTVDRLEREGIEPERVEFVPRQTRRDYLELYYRIDVGLDSFPYNGHTTSLDSFWMGVPVVTLVGQMAVGRGGWSQLNNLGLKELAAFDPEQFVRAAVELAGDMGRLTRLRRTLRQRMLDSPLMDARRFARGIEAIYRGVWKEWCARPAGDGPS